MQSTRALNAVFPFVFLNKHSDALKSAFRYIILYTVYNDIPFAKSVFECHCKYIYCKCVLHPYLQACT